MVMRCVELLQPMVVNLPALLFWQRGIRLAMFIICCTRTGVELESKGIAIGVRLEHPQQLIDSIQYHNPEGRGKYLPAAEYSFVTQVKGRGVYSFCMCPGGFVVPAASGPEQIVVNGMSPSNRGSVWANSGMVVELQPEDFGARFSMFGVLAGIKFQEDLERQCYLNGNCKQTAPAQRMTDFVNRRNSFDLPRSSYSPGLIASPLHFWLPDFIVSRLQEGFKYFGNVSHGFLTREAVMIGVETRTSSPVRIPRDRESMTHIRLQGDFTLVARALVMREELFRPLSMENVVPKLWLCKLNNRRLSIVLFKTNI